MKGPLLNLGKTGREGHIGQIGTPIECVYIKVGHAGWDGHTGQVGIIQERVMSNTGNAGGYRQLRHGPQHVGRILPDGRGHARSQPGVAVDLIQDDICIALPPNVLPFRIKLVPNGMKIKLFAPFFAHLLQKMNKFMNTRGSWKTWLMIILSKLYISDIVT